MALRLALVIEGDAAGAKKALQEAAGGVDELGRKADQASRKIERVGRVEWNDAEFDRARNGLKATADEGERAAESVRAVADAGGRAAPEIGKMGDAAEVAGGKVGALGTVLIGAAGGLAAGIAITAIGEGLKIAAGAAADLVREITSNQPKIARALEDHAGLVAKVKGAWAEASGAASSYGLNAASVLRFESQQNVGRLEEATRASQRDLVQGSDALRPSDVLGNPFGRFGPLKAEVEGFRQELREGQADVIEFRRQVGAIAGALPKDSPFRRLAEQILEDTKAASELQAELERSRDLLDGLQGDAEASATALGGSAEKYRDLGGAAGEAAPAIGAGADEIRRSGEAAAGANPALAETDRLLKSIAGGAAVPTDLLGSPARAAATPLTEGRTFAGGGFTGHMPADRIAGLVHGREYVFDAASTSRIGVANLDAIRAGVAGYASGGYVGAVPSGLSGRSPVAASAEDFRILSGSLHQFLSAIAQGQDVMKTLAGVVDRVSQRFLDFAFRALDQALLGGGSGGGGLLGGIVGAVGQAFGFGGIGGNVFPPAPLAPVGLYHGGGRVGAGPQLSRAVPASVFIGAPRMHTGGLLKPGERPVIAMDGEEIGWPDQLARKYGQGQTVVNNFNIETPNPKAFAESRASVARAGARFASRFGRYS
ncbi:hypothetical protein [Nitratireductor soli]|uniref:hypothetical protein n=1 Tax=Nitratireductor soli TaxID=1670619 RepID=UPI00065DE97E|nr:hypothetical protein [Nitratireductor soli]